MSEEHEKQDKNGPWQVFIIFIIMISLSIAYINWTGEGYGNDKKGLPSCSESPS